MNELNGWTKAGQVLAVEEMMERTERHPEV